MKLYEITRMAATPFLPPLAWRVRKTLQAQLRSQFKDRNPIKLLDVGARRSPYTIGLNRVQVTLMDIGRDTKQQVDYDLGADATMMLRTMRRRSNVEKYILQDFTVNTLADQSYDVVTAIEVLEHVPDDDEFVRQAARVLSPGGFVLFTTPNGDDIPKPSPQHLRHYKADQLADLFTKQFEHVAVFPVLVSNRYWKTCHQPWAFQRPITLINVAINNFIYKLSKASRDRGVGIKHILFVIASRPRIAAAGTSNSDQIQPPSK